MKSGPRVALLFGGRSVEHEVSVVSARAVVAASRQGSIDCLPIGVTEQGRWLPPETSRRILEGGDTRVELPAGQEDERLVLDPGGGGILRSGPGGRCEPLSVDAVFPLVHGWGGEDGRVQGALDLASLPCVGAGVVGSAVGMDKDLAKRLLRDAGLPVVPWLALAEPTVRAARQSTCDRIIEELGSTLFVKPANGGSSVGIRKVTTPDELPAALDTAFEHDRRVVVERAVDAREIECAVLGNDEPRASGLGEIVPSGEFYDYAAKYLDGTSELRIPAELDPDSTRSIRRDALCAFDALGLCGFARVDFLLERRTGRAYLNEVNTLPGFTPISMFPRLWEAEGVSFPALVDRLVALALERFREEKNKTRRLRSD